MKIKDNEKVFKGLDSLLFYLKYYIYCIGLDFNAESKKRAIINLIEIYQQETKDLIESGQVQALKDYMDKAFEWQKDKQTNL